MACIIPVEKLRLTSQAVVSAAAAATRLVVVEALTAVEELAATAVVPNTFDNVTEASESSEPGVPKGNVLGWLPLVTLLLVAGSKKMLGSLAGSCA